MVSNHSCIYSNFFFFFCNKGYILNLEYSSNNLSLYLFVQFGFMLIALIWKYDFSPFMVLIIAILNDGEFLFLHFSL